MSIKKARKVPEGSTTIITISFKFPITDEEARKFLNKPNSPVSKKLSKYLFDTLKHACKKGLESIEKENSEKHKE